jgi:nicotinate phosphoribosyltransferase
MPEGTVVFPGEPLVRITAPIVQAQLVETFVLNQVHYQSLTAIKAACVRSPSITTIIVDIPGRIDERIRGMGFRFR